MKTIYIKEWKEYSKSKILEKLDNDREAFEQLLKYAIIDKEKDKYQFKYVGVIIINDFVINCYPKYVPDKIDPNDDFKEVLKVIKRYKNFHEDIDYQNEELEEISYNQLSMMIFFLEDYYEWGVYSNTQRILQINGNGEIDWDRTINYTTPIIKDKMPYHVELYTKYNINDLNDYFRLLHEYIITTCSKRLEDAGLLELFDLTSVELSDKFEEDFGEKDYILNRISQEINVEFNSHKQKLLKSMHTFILEENSFSNRNFLTVYGTRTYHVIWEEICKKVFNDYLERQLFELPIDLNEKYDESMKLIEVIEKPKWVLKDGTVKEADGTFIPDIITFLEDKFIIFDAKYYDITFNRDELTGQPELSSIVKQYFYQLAYDEFVEAHDELNCVKNAFLFPSYENEIVNKGHVELEILSSLNLENIQVIMLPVKTVNQCYLAEKTMDISDLNL